MKKIVAVAAVFLLVLCSLACQALEYRCCVVSGLGAGDSIAQAKVGNQVVGQGWDADTGRRYAFVSDTTTGQTTKFYDNYSISTADYLAGRVKLVVNNETILDWNGRPYRNYTQYYRPMLLDGVLRFHIPGTGETTDDITTGLYLGGFSAIAGATDNGLGVMITVKTAQDKYVPYLYNPDSNTIQSFEAPQSWWMVSCNAKGQAMGTTDGVSSMVFWDGDKLTTLTNIGAVVAPLTDSGMAALMGYCSPKFFDTTTGALFNPPSPPSVFTPDILDICGDCFVGSINGALGYGGQAVWWEPAPVPEPTSLFVLASGLLGAFGLLRRKHRVD